MVVVMLFFLVASAEAALIDRGGGFIYDDVQLITWAQDANINGVDTWANQVAWAAGYSQTHTVYGTFDDWRLPTTQQPDLSCSEHYPGLGLYQGYDCTGSEMGHLFNVDGISSSSMGLFTNPHQKLPHLYPSRILVLDVESPKQFGRTMRWDNEVWLECAQVETLKSSVCSSRTAALQIGHCGRWRCATATSPLFPSPPPPSS
jgi:hypothetical protein